MSFTKADGVRAKSDEELAEMMASLLLETRCNAFVEVYEVFEKKTQNEVLIWLGKEVLSMGEEVFGGKSRLVEEFLRQLKEPADLTE